MVDGSRSKRERVGIPRAPPDPRGLRVPASKSPVQIGRLSSPLANHRDAPNESASSAASVATTILGAMVGGRSVPIGEARERRCRVLAAAGEFFLILSAPSGGTRGGAPGARSERAARVASLELESGTLSQTQDDDRIETRKRASLTAVRGSHGRAWAPPAALGGSRGWAPAPAARDAPPRSGRGGGGRSCGDGCGGRGCGAAIRRLAPSCGARGGARRAPFVRRHAGWPPGGGRLGSRSVRVSALREGSRGARRGAQREGRTGKGRGWYGGAAPGEGGAARERMGRPGCAPPSVRVDGAPRREFIKQLQRRRRLKEWGGGRGKYGARAASDAESRRDRARAGGKTAKGGGRRSEVARAAQEPSDRSCGVWVEVSDARRSRRSRRLSLALPRRLAAPCASRRPGGAGGPGPSSDASRRTTRGPTPHVAEDTRY